MVAACHATMMAAETVTFSRRQWQHRAEGVARRVLAVAASVRPLELVSIQDCQSRSVRDTAAFVDACRGPAPGEFMPFWSSSEPYTAMIARDPNRLRIALSHQWGDYRATPEIAAELQRVGKFLEGLGHSVDYALPDLDYREAFAAQTTCYISNFAVVIGNTLAARGLERPPHDLIETVNIRIW
jgi:Asp-tRNA(Asn)/Glu-tRNA(Gln) amidotransferase A subunit family amidase